VLHEPSGVSLVETGSNTALLAFLNIEQQLKAQKVKEQQKSAIYA
jgi:hypothetical protein